MKCKDKITLGDNTTYEVLYSDTIGMKNSFSIKKVLLKDVLKQNLIIILKYYNKSSIGKILNIMSILNLHNKFVIEGVKVNNIYMIMVDS